jgi:hypothetical protein
MVSQSAMDIGRLIDTLREDLVRSAEVGGPEARAAAERLMLALEPAIRLTLMETLTEAAAEIGEALPGVTLEVRLKGREPVFVVEGAPAPAAEAARETSETEDGEAVARITLRLPEGLKARAEQLAARRGQSLNTWLVAAARTAADGPRGRHGFGGQHMHGWAR